MQNKLFNKSSLEKISSPEKLNDYIQVANPSIWMVLAAALLLLMSICIWAIFGNVSTVETVSGVALDGQIVCYINPNSDIAVQPGMQVAVSGNLAAAATGEVVEVSSVPLSYVEACEGIDSDYVIYALGISDWNVRTVVSADAELTEGAIYTVSITTESIHPIQMVFD